MKRYHFLFLLIPICSLLPACSKNAPSPTAIQASPAGLLSRYDLGVSSYDTRPVTTFVLSFNNSNQVTDAFEKNGQTLIAYGMTYTSGILTRSNDNSLGTQLYSFDANGRITLINYANPSDTGKRVFTYDAAGKLLSVLDSVTNPPSFPIRYQYLYTYDNAGQNVVEIDQNQLDLAGRPTLVQQTFYTFDNKTNAFKGFPPLLEAHQLPGDIPALFNANNVAAEHQVGTIPATSTGSSVPTLDTIATYNTTRTYQYNAQGYPTICQETFQDIQYNYSGKRSYTYNY